jgi:hypothetical protein
MMHEREKSDSAVVARRPANKAERSAAEPALRRSASGPGCVETGYSAQGRSSRKRNGGFG